MRDYFTPDIREVLIDEPRTFEQVREFVSKVMPRYRSRIRFYQDEAPLFSTYNIDAQVETTSMPEVKLPSGGAIVIEQLEALVAIDVNSGKATQGGSIEDTAFQTNLEAAEEVSRQLRLRDLGGLVVVDFIDMLDKRHRLSLERKMSEVVAGDKARVELGHLSKFGLFEMSRQRLRAPLATQSHQNCPVCAGRGQVKDPNLVALEALRKVQAAIIVGGVDIAKVRLHPNAALILLNNKRSEISKLEQEKGVTILVLADGRLRPDEVQFEMETAPKDEGTALNRAPVKASIAGGAEEEETAPGKESRKKAVEASS